MKLPRHIPTILFAVVLIAMFALQVGTARQESQTIDEGVHLSAGLSYLRTGDFRLNPEHPPLIKMLAAIPLLFTNVTLPTNNITWQTWDQYQFGKVFLYQNTLAPQTILFLGRLPIMLLSILLGWWIFRASREMFGLWGGLLSVTLYALEPGFIAHGHYVTTDLGFTAFSFFSVIRLVKLLDQPTKKNALWYGLALFIAGLSKFSAIAWLGVLLITLLLLKLRERHHPVLQFRNVARIILIALPIVAIITWAIYGFDIRRRADDPRVTLLFAQRQDYLATHDVSNDSPLVRFVMERVGDRTNGIGAWLDRSQYWPTPGYAFFRGAITVVGHSIGGQEAYLLGKFSDTGWWYYFPVAFLTKTSTPTLLAFFSLVFVVGTYIFQRRRTSVSWRNIYIQSDRRWFIFIAVPTLFFLGSMMSHLNLGWRHIMPVYPYLFVLAGALTTTKVFPNPKLRFMVPLCLGLGMVVVQFMTYPNEIGYFNSFAGGSNNGQHILIDSNLDWGQDLPKLAAFMTQNNLATIPFAGYGFFELSSYLQATPLPTDSEVAVGNMPHDFVAISVGALVSRNPQYTWLNNYKPYQRLGSGIFIYRLP